MLFSTPALLVLSALGVTARPASRFVSVLTESNNALRHIPEGKTAISRSDMAELARLAVVASQAYCPQDRKLQPQRRGEQVHWVSGPTSHVITSSHERPPYEEALNMHWYIAHTPSTQTLTLSFSSLPSVDGMLELLSSDPDVHNHTHLHGEHQNLVDLPSWLFPHEYLPHLPPPAMHHAYLSALETHGTDAVVALLDILANPIAPSRTNTDVIASMLASWTGSATALRTPSIKHVEIVGHGLGAAVGLLTALALHMEITGPAATAYATPLPEVDITASLFGLPRVGDQVFADWVDELVDAPRSQLKIRRITSYADTIPHLPERHLDLVHPAIPEIWVGADPRTAYACKGPQAGCSDLIPLPKTSLMDHAGPFAGVWVGASACRRPEASAPHAGF